MQLTMPEMVYRRKMGIPGQLLCSNNVVIIANLKLGFHITGMEYSEELGPLVRLTYFHGKHRSQLFKQRARALC